LIRTCGADRLLHGDDCRQGLSVVRDMVCGDLETPGGDEEEDVVMFPHDLDVSFITGADVINGSFMFQVEAVAIEGSGRGIVQHRLEGHINIEHRPHNEGSFPGADGEGHVEGKDKAEDIGGVVDFDEVHTWLLRE